MCMHVCVNVYTNADGWVNTGICLHKHTPACKHKKVQGDMMEAKKNPLVKEREV